MFEQLTTHYLWWILALVLIALEVMMPGYFMLWIGIAAALTGVFVLIVPTATLAIQALAFALLTFLCCAAYWYGIRPRLRRDEPGAQLLNRRAEQMIGKRYVLIEPIVNGRGKAKVGDGQWLVSGNDLPAGQTVEVTAVNGTTLLVRAVD